MREFFLGSPWPATIAWALIYISDFVLTITCARLYRRHLANKIVFEGSFELNPVFQREVDTMKYWSPRFLLLLVLSSTWLVVCWALAMPSSPELYTFVIGGVICMQLAIHVRHLGNLHLFRSPLTAEQVSGRIEYARPLILQKSSVQMLGFAIMFGLLFAFTGSWFVGGGMVSCFALSGKHWYLARRAAAKRAANVEQAFAKSTAV